LTNTTLTTLDLDGNDIGAVGAQALATALLTNTTLETLSLDGNDIGDVGAQALATALLTNTTLITLILYENNFGAVGVQALVDTLATNTTLTDLYLLSQCTDGIDALREERLLRNRALWEQQYWTSWRHTCIASADPSCHTIVMASLVCGDNFSLRLPPHVWCNIFSFWQRRIFIRPAYREGFD
jgi:hypothetical protein